MNKQEEFKATFLERSLMSLGFYGLAEKRMVSRASCEHTRSYLASGGRGRMTKDWMHEKSNDINRAWSSDSKVIRERARGLFFNNGYGNRISKGIVNSVVGEGIQTQFTIDFFPTWIPKTEDQVKEKDQANEFLNTEQEEYNKLFLDKIDITDEANGCEFQRLNMQTISIDGESLVQRIWLKDSTRRFPYAYKMMKGERLSSYNCHNVGSGNEVYEGIEVNSYGQKVAFHILENQYTTKTIRVPAEDMIHSYRMDYPEQLRGFSWYTPIIPDLNNTIAVNDYAVISRKVQSAIALVLHKKPGATSNIPTLGKNDEVSTDKTTTLQAGLIYNAGEAEVHSHMPTPTNDLEALVNHQLRGIAVGCAHSYELLSGDYRHTSFAGGRLAKLDSDRNFNVLHDWFVNKSQKKQHTHFIESQLLTGGIKKQRVAGRLINLRTVNLQKCSFSRRKLELGVNPLQEVKAMVELVKHKLSTFRAETEGRGKDFSEHMKQIVTEADFYEELFSKIEETPDEPKEPQEPVK